ncbi:MAG: discoidin domain-containing protein [Candidatus Omnitrophica bacterium]|nr:discoidin domain-containing protein [Candidatus Omnitrophota bacterium]
MSLLKKRKFFFPAMMLITAFLTSLLSWATVELYTEFGMEETPAGWEGMHDTKHVARPPEVTVVADAVEGGTAVRATAVEEGKYQGIKFTFPGPIDLTQYSSLSFHVKQSFYTSKNADCVLRINSAGGNGIWRNIKTGTGSWTLVETPIDTENWEPTSTKTPVDMGKMVSLTIYPYGHPWKPGQYITIDGLEFKSPTGETEKIPVAGYRYNTAPTLGDAGNNALADGVAEKEKQVLWEHSAGSPDIVFDLGGKYLIEGIKVEAIDIPSRNISDITVFVSTDNKDWEILTSIANIDDSGTEKHQVLEKKGLQATGQYVRMQVNRPRHDIHANIAEVTFFGRPAMEQDVKKSAEEASYRIGPEMPETNTTDYWLMEDGKQKLWVYKKNGVINGFTEGDKKLAERIFDIYSLNSKDSEVKSDDYKSRVVSSRTQGKNLYLTIENEELPGIRIEKRYMLGGGRLERELKVTKTSAGIKGFLFITREVVLNRDYRKDGVYESWGAGHHLERRFASEIVFDMLVDMVPVVSFENPKEKSTFFNYRYRWNGEYVHIGAGMGGGYLLSGNKSTVFTPTGWRQGAAVFDMSEDRLQSAETHLVYTAGTLIDAYNYYLDMPLVKKFRGGIKRPAWLAEVRTSTGGTLSYPGNIKKMLQPFLLLLREGYILSPANTGNDFIWGDFPSEGEVRGQSGGKWTAEELKEEIAGVKALSPRIKIGLYTWFWSAMPESEPVQTHPEWFVTKDRTGQTLNYFPGFPLNYFRFAGIKESQDDMFNRIMKMVNCYGLDIWYLDGGSTESSIDWWNMRLDRPTGWQNLYARVREQMQKEDPDRIVFFNTPEMPLGDFGYWESHSGAMTSHWRTGARWMWKFKLFQHRDPLHFPVCIYWLPSVEGAYEDYMAGTGLFADYASRYIYPKDIPYLSAQYEVRFLRLVDAGISPNWRFDMDTLLEAYALVHGENTGFVFIKSHDEKPWKAKVAVDLAPMGIADRNKPVYHWAFDIKDARRFDGRFGEQELEKLYRNSGWVMDRAVEPRFLGTTEWRERLERSFDTEFERLTVWVMTQTPAFVYSADGLPLQYWLPDNLGVKVTGQVKGKQIELSVDSSRETAEIAALLPDGFNAGKALVAGRETRGRIMIAGGTRMLIIPVGKGIHKVSLQLLDEQPPETAPEITVNKQENKLQVGIKTKSGWPGKNAIVQAVKENAVYWSGNIVIKDSDAVMEIPVPASVEGGTYRITIADSSGLRSAEKKITLAEGKPETAMLKEYYWTQVSLPLEEKVTDSAASSGGFDIKRHALRYSKEAGLSSADINNRTINIRTLPKIKSPWNEVFAGMEIKTKRYLKLRLSGNFRYFLTHGHSARGGSHSTRGPNPSYFVGLFLDFNTADGYKTRTMAGLGGIDPKFGGVNGTFIPWGTGRKPEYFFHLHDFAARSDINETEIWIDLWQLGAPEGWDGWLWITPGMSMVKADRTMTVTLLETSDTLPEEAEIAEGKDLLAAPSAPLVFNVPMSDTARFEQALKIEGMTLLGIPYRSAKYKTAVSAIHDNKNLYLRFEAEDEQNREFFYIANPASPWRNDGIEFCLRIAGTKRDFLHVIVDAAGNIYRMIEDAMSGGKREAVNYPEEINVVSKKGSYTVTFAVPLEKLGITGNAAGKEIGFNFMRNYHHEGTEEWWTLVPGNSYFEVERFYTMVLQ